jgi:hypothetical protein
MIMKQLTTALFISLLHIACGSDKPVTETVSSTSQSRPETVEETSDSKGEVMHQMPTGDQIDEGYEAILEKADVDDPELLEVYVSFSKSIDSPEIERAHMSVQMVSPQNKNKVVQYLYDFGKKEIEGPKEVTLSSGLGAKEEFIDTYDGFKGSLFKKSEIMDFDEADDVYEKAIAKSRYEPKDCYVNNLQFKYSPRVGLNGDVSVQSTRSTSAHKTFVVDKAGTVIDD